MYIEKTYKNLNLSIFQIKENYIQVKVYNNQLDTNEKYKQLDMRNKEFKEFYNLCKSKFSKVSYHNKLLSIRK